MKIKYLNCFFIFSLQMCRRDLILTSKCLYLIGRESIKKEPKKSRCMEVIKRKLRFEQISHISLSTLQVYKITISFIKNQNIV
jgi:hypothetical protein